MISRGLVNVGALRLRVGESGVACVCVCVCLREPRGSECVSVCREWGKSRLKRETNRGKGRGKRG